MCTNKSPVLYPSTEGTPLFFSLKVFPLWVPGSTFILTFPFTVGISVEVPNTASEKLIYLSGRNISHDGQGEGIEIQEIGHRPGEKLYEELLISGDKLETSNDKIFRSVEKYLSKEVLTKVLDDLYNASKTNYVIKNRNILKSNVEGFKEAKNES